MLHGWGQTQAMFKHQFEGLAKHRRVITLDQRGHGLSAKPRCGYRLARFAQDFKDLPDHLEIASTDRLGWSMGVSVLWSYLDQNGSSRNRKFVAVDQSAAVAAVPWMLPAAQAESGAIFDVVSRLTELGGQLTGPDGAAMTEAFMRSMFLGDPAAELCDFFAVQIKTVPAHAAVPLLFDHPGGDLSAAAWPGRLQACMTEQTPSHPAATGPRAVSRRLTSDLPRPDG